MRNNLGEQIHEKLKGNVCPKCTSRIDAATRVKDPPMIPKACDITICFYCASTLIFNKDLSVRLSKVSDIRKLDHDTQYELQTARLAVIKEIIKTQRGKNN